MCVFVFSVFCTWLISLLEISMQQCLLLGQGAPQTVQCWMLKQATREPSFCMANTPLAEVMIDLDGVIKKDWLVLSKDNHDSFTTGTETGWVFACLVELRNISRSPLVMCHLLWYHLFFLFLFVVVWSLFRPVYTSHSVISFPSDAFVFASHLSCSSHPAG